MKSIIQSDLKSCFLCGARATETHHVFGGAMRKKSDKLGLTVRLCHNCHNEPPKEGVHSGGVHFNKAKMDYLHQTGQREAMRRFGWSVDEFRAEFYKSYI